MARSRPLLLCALVLFAGTLTPAAKGQEPELPTILEFVLTVDKSTIVVPMGSVAYMTVTVTDESRDSPNPFLPDDTSGPPLVTHTLEFDLDYRGEQPRGWTVLIPPLQPIRSGESKDFRFGISVNPDAEAVFFPFTINVTMRGHGEEIRRAVDLTGTSPGLQAFSAGVPRGLLLEPKGIGSVPIRITNAGIFPRLFDIEPVDNPCNLGIGQPGTILVSGHETKQVLVTIEAPAAKFWYNSQYCSVRFAVTPQDNPNQVMAATANIQVDGFYVDPQWVINTVIVVLVILILFFFVKRRKERVEEAILGKPQKPWTIPAEAVYLEHLKEKDPRAHHVVRHYLMEDEYRSSLLWYYAYKRATKGQRAKERLIVKEESSFEKWRDQWAKKATRPERRADAYDEKLQARLDKKARKRQKKAAKKWETEGEKLEAAHAKEKARANLKWQKQVRKAEKKGQALPPEPDIEEPDFGEEPELEPIPLATHKWQAKADKYRTRMEKKETRIRARFDRKQQRRLKEVRRKVQRLGRKLDDTQFIEEHPLLKQAEQA